MVIWQVAGSTAVVHIQEAFTVLVEAVFPVVVFPAAVFPADPITAPVVIIPAVAVVMAADLSC